MTAERSLALYRRMLHVLPREFRNENGEEMERLFAEALVEARAKDLSWISKPKTIFRRHSSTGN